MKKRTMIIMAGVLIAAGGAVAAAAVGDAHGRFGRGHHGMHGMHGMVPGGLGFGPGIGAGGIAGWIERLDANKDGVITLDEALARRQPAFARIDKNGDGVIDAQEIEAETKLNVDYWTKAMLHRFDRDRDGRITQAEFAEATRRPMGMRGDDGGRRGGGQMGWEGRGGRPGQDGSGMTPGDGPRWGWMRARMADHMFERVDLNSDGVLDAGEIETAVKQRVTRRINEFVRRFDQDGDGRVSREEFEKPTRERFALFDINDDGKISQEDLPPAMRGRGLLR